MILNQRINLCKEVSIKALEQSACKLKEQYSKEVSIRIYIESYVRRSIGVGLSAGLICECLHFYNHDLNKKINDEWYDIYK